MSRNCSHGTAIPGEFTPLPAIWWRKRPNHVTLTRRQWSESGPEEAEVAPDFTEFVAARWASLVRVARLLTGDFAPAEDLVQATLVKAYVRWSRISRADSPEAYVRKMLLHEFLSEHRTGARRSAKAPLVAVAETVPEEDSAERLDLWEQVRALPPRQRAVLVLRYYEDLTEAEIAHVLGISPGTVKSQAHDALRTLRGRLPAYDPAHDPDYDPDHDTGVSS